MTPTEKRIYQRLSDGAAHPASLLMECLYADLAEEGTLRVHLSSLRKKIRPNGEDVLCQRDNGTTYYRLVRLLASPYDGKR